MEFIGIKQTTRQTLQGGMVAITKAGAMVRIPRPLIVLILCLMLISPALTARTAEPPMAAARQRVKPAPRAVIKRPVISKGNTQLAMNAEQAMPTASRQSMKPAPRAVIKRPVISKENAQLAMNAKLTMPEVIRHTVYQYMPDASQSLGTETKLAEISKEVAGKVFYELKAAGQRHLSSTVAVVEAVPLSDLKRETEFGRLIAEYYLTDLADRGLRVKELRLDKDINILPQTGEFILSRNTGEIANDKPALDYVVASTFTNTRKTLILQGRLISLKTGLIKTSWRYTLPLNRELLALLSNGRQKPFTIAVKGIGQ
ncbi:hypothetical protein MNBD_DELTA03-1011 [hydrothermal vent metagenome]|uniref:FlgO domain-containing protein n=1 Tax=hydrothermal vent metagenome TaxID=652676 RepID=A0A3B0WE96_9ZZZZ